MNREVSAAESMVIEGAVNLLVEFGEAYAFGVRHDKGRRGGSRVLE